MFTALASVRSLGKSAGVASVLITQRLVVQIHPPQPKDSRVYEERNVVLRVLTLDAIHKTLNDSPLCPQDERLKIEIARLQPENFTDVQTETRVFLVSVLASFCA